MVYRAIIQLGVRIFPVETVFIFVGSCMGGWPSQFLPRSDFGGGTIEDLRNQVGSVRGKGNGLGGIGSQMNQNLNVQRSCSTRTISEACQNHELQPMSS
jgi:hypothetical protein